MTKHYKYSIVFHNLRPGSKAAFQAAFAKIPKFKREVSAEEQYCDEEGNPLTDRPDRHLHVFVEFYNQRHFHSVLKICERIKKPHLWPTQLVEGMWGRVQIDAGRGTIEECLDYLEGGTKSKPLDGDVLQINEVPPPGYYRCYSCKAHHNPYNMKITHPNQTGVCGPCYWKTKDTYPGEWEYFPELERSIYIFEKSDFPRPGLFSQPIVPNFQNDFLQQS